MDRLEEIKGRVEAAESPAPWRYSEGTPGEVWLSVGKRVVVGAKYHKGDAEFIAHAREDVPWLCERVDTLTAEAECEVCGTEWDGGDDEAKCPKSRRPCGHHCNHIMTHDGCDWCGGEYEAPDDDSDPVWVPGPDQRRLDALLAVLPLAAELAYVGADEMAEAPSITLALRRKVLNAIDVANGGEPFWDAWVVSQHVPASTLRDRAEAAESEVARLKEALTALAAYNGQHLPKCNVVRELRLPRGCDCGLRFQLDRARILVGATPDQEEKKP